MNSKDNNQYFSKRQYRKNNFGMKRFITMILWEMPWQIRLGMCNSSRVVTYRESWQTIAKG